MTVRVLCPLRILSRCRQTIKVECASVLAPVTFSRQLSWYPKEPFKAKYVSPDNQSVLLEGKEKIRASKLLDDPYRFSKEIPGAPELQTVYHILDFGLKVSNDGECIGSRSGEQYTWQKYSEVIKRSKYIGSALVHLGFEPGSEDYVGVFAANREEFYITMFACAGYSLVFVPVHTTLDDETIHFITDQTNVPLMMTSSNKNTLSVLSSIEKGSRVKTIVIMDEPNLEVKKQAEAMQIKLITFSELEEIGMRNLKDLILPKPDDLFCIPYTSGTTGTPKGVMVTHKNMMGCVSSLVYAYGEIGSFGGTIISYLPPAHIYEIVNQVFSTYFARRIGFYKGDVKDLLDEVRSLKPSILPLVPRLMKVIYAKVMEDIKSSKIKSFLFNVAYSRKDKLVKRGIINNTSIWDKLVFKKFQDFLGGNLHAILTTSAPVPREVMMFFRRAAGCYVVEAYGQTELCAVTLTLPREHDGGFVGAPVPCNHVKLVDVPEKGYYAKNNVGEICVKGSNVFKGYFGNPKATEEAFDEDGWFHCGDIGSWLPNGALQIIDRNKHIFKLSQGEYITPENVENAYLNSKYVAQIFVDGMATEDYVVAIVVPDEVSFKQWAKTKGYKSKDMFHLTQDKEIRRNILLELHKVGKAEGLTSLEQAKNIAIITEPFTIANEMLTPTFKLKRDKARKQYECLITKMYAEGPLIKSVKRS